MLDRDPGADGFNHLFSQLIDRGLDSGADIEYTAGRRVFPGRPDICLHHITDINKIPGPGSVSEDDGRLFRQSPEGEDSDRAGLRFDGLAGTVHIEVAEPDGIKTQLIVKDFEIGLPADFGGGIGGEE